MRNGRWIYGKRKLWRGVKKGRMVGGDKINELICFILLLMGRNG
jgi:hypothetical protein